MKAKVLFDNVLIKPIKKKKETKGGILLPENKDNNDIVEGIVVTTGPGKELPVVMQGIGGLSYLAKDPVVVKENDHVVFQQYAGRGIKLDGEQYFLINQRDILAVIQYER